MNNFDNHFDKMLSSAEPNQFQIVFSNLVKVSAALEHVLEVRGGGAVP